MLERIRKELTQAMKAGEKDRVRTLRMLLTDLKLSQVEKRDGLEEADILKVVKKNVKQRKESAQQYRDADRPELAEKEEQEITILEAYLPKQLSDEEIEKEAKNIIGELGVSAKKEMGLVMKEFMARFPGMADGKKVQAAVLSQLK